jgi:dihydrolipoamide dehydrogenase
MSLRLTILGAGPGGYVAAIRAAQLGAEVTVIEQEELGGTCLNWGCIPTKALWATTGAMATARRLQEFGGSVSGEITFDLESVRARKDRVVKDLVGGIYHMFKHHRIRLISGRGTVLKPGLVRVEGAGGETADVEGDRLIVATGSFPVEIPGLTFDGTRIMSSNHALMLDRVPEELVIVGGGVVGCEFAFIYNELGSKVTVVEALDRVVGLPSVDQDLSKTLGREMKKRKIKFHLDKVVTKTEVTPDGRVDLTLGPSPFLKVVKEKDKREVSLSADAVLVCVGRGVNSAGLGLEEIGVDLDEKGNVLVNDRMQTNVDGVYAIGDVLGPQKIMLAHVASAEGLVAVENVLGGDRSMDYGVVPAGIFTVPEMAVVGLSEEQARDQGLDYRADATLFRDLGKAQAMGEIEGLVKIVSENNTGRILGAHIIGPHATDLIAEAALAMRVGATVSDLADTIHLHPSLSEAVYETAQAALDRRLHGVPRK